MSVNKFKIRIGDFDKDNNLKIPLSLDFSSADQLEVVNKEFISVETEKAINPIIDYDKVRFTPIKANQVDLVKDLKINLNFLNSSGSYNNITHYSDIGFTDDDIKFKKNKFLNSFLKLSFYDSDAPTNQNLVSIVTIFSKVTQSDVKPLSVVGGGLPNNANKFIVRYLLNNPVTTPEGFAEGFYLYHFKSDLETPDNGINLYMRAEFNNAATGKITKFITTNELLNINSLIKKLHTKYLLTRDTTGYFYSLDPSYNNATNITETGTGVTLDLFEIRVE
jgi:hypothetical protein